MDATRGWKIACVVVAVVLAVLLVSVHLDRQAVHVDGHVPHPVPAASGLDAPTAPTAHGLDELDKLPQGINGEDALGRLRQLRAVGIRPGSRESHRGAVADAHHDLRRSFRRHIEDLSLEWMMPSRHPHLRSRKSAVVLIV
jgi:hypothetical protein